MTANELASELRLVRSTYEQRMERLLSARDLAHDRNAIDFAIAAVLELEKVQEALYGQCVACIFRRTSTEEPPCQNCIHRFYEGWGHPNEDNWEWFGGEYKSDKEPSSGQRRNAMQAELQRVTRERDAAVADLRMLVSRYCLCFRCGHDAVPDYRTCHDCQDNDWRGWEWSGPPEDEEVNINATERG